MTITQVFTPYGDVPAVGQTQVQYDDNWYNWMTVAALHVAEFASFATQANALRDEVNASAVNVSSNLASSAILADQVSTDTALTSSNASQVSADKASVASDKAYVQSVSASIPGLILGSGIVVDSGEPITQYAKDAILINGQPVLVVGDVGSKQIDITSMGKIGTATATMTDGQRLEIAITAGATVAPSKIKVAEPMQGLTNNDWSIETNDTMWRFKDHAYDDSITPGATSGDTTLTLVGGVWSEDDVGNKVYGNGGVALITAIDKSVFDSPLNLPYVTSEYSNVPGQIAGQLFTLSESTNIGTIQYMLWADAAPSETARVLIYASSGGGSPIHTGAILATSGEKDVSGISQVEASPELVSFIFAGETLSAGDYFAMLSSASADINLQRTQADPVDSAKSDINGVAGGTYDFDIRVSSEETKIANVTVSTPFSDTSSISSGSWAMYAGEISNGAFQITGPPHPPMYVAMVTTSEGGVDSEFITDINTVTVTESLNGGEAYYAISIDDVWKIVTAGDVLDIASNKNSVTGETEGVWQYVDVVDGIGPNLVTSWANDGTYVFPTFTTSGSSITSAINSTYAGANTNSLGLTVGEFYKLSVNFTLNSGAFPNVYTASTTNGTNGSISSVLSSGVNEFYFTATSSDIYLRLWLSDSAASNFSLTASIIETDETWAPATINDEITALEDAIAVGRNRMDSTSVNAATGSWPEPGMNIGFAAISKAPDTTSTPLVSSIEFNYDANARYESQNPIFGTSSDPEGFVIDDSQYVGEGDADSVGVIAPSSGGPWNVEITIYGGR